MDLVTCFKNKHPTFFTFDTFYKRYWKVKHSYYIIGYTSEVHKEYILQTYILDSSITLQRYGNIDNVLIKNVEIWKDIDTTFILYETPENYALPARTWDAMKCKLMMFFYKHFDTTKIISIDSDEFLYAKNITTIKNNHRFHYLEIMLKDTFNIEDDIEWCIQSWCNIKYFGQKKTSQDCTSCKTFNFNHRDNPYNINKYMLSFRHSGKDLLFKDSACETVNNKSLDLEEALKRGVCFHLIGLTKRQLVESKEKRWNNHWDTFFTKNDILKEVYGTVTCNILKEYIDPRDYQ